MDQKLTFTAFLNDEYSKNFDKLASRSDADIKSIEKNLAKLGKTGKTVTRSIDELNKRIDVLTRVRKISVDTKAIKFATQEIKNLQRERDRLEGIGNGGSGKGGSSIWNIAKGVGIAQYAPRAIGMAVGVFRDAMEANMEREQQRISMGVLMGGQKEGDELVEKLRKKAAATPFTTADLLKSAQTQLGFGVAKDKVTGIIDQLGDISGGNSERFQSLTLAFSQMSAAGRLMGQDLLQMVNAGFNPLKQISEMTGKSMGALKKEMEEGKISADLVVKAMSKATSEGGLYYQMMEKQSKTTAGRISTLKDEYNEMAVALGEKFKPAIDGSITLLSAMIGTVKEWTQIPISDKIKKQADNLRALKTELMDTNIQEERRKEILSQIKSDYGDYLKGLNLEKAGYQEINAALETTISLLDKKSQKARLDEILQGSQDNLSNLYKGRTSLVSSIYKQYGNQFPDIMNKEGLTTEQRIKLIRDRLKGQSIGNIAGAPSAFEGETAYTIDSFFDINKDIIKAQKNLKETTADVQRQMKDEGLYGLDKAAKDDGTGNPGSSSGSVSGNGSSASSSISGGSQVKNITINIDSLIKGGVNVHSTTLREGATQVKDVVLETLLSAVNDANLAVGN